MGFSKERANFIQAGIAPTIAFKLRDNLSIGVGLGVVNEFFRARGVIVPTPQGPARLPRSEEHTSELQSLMRISYAVFCLKKKKYTKESPCKSLARISSKQYPK